MKAWQKLRSQSRNLGHLMMTEATTLRSRLANPDVLIIWYIGGLIMFFGFANWEIELWTQTYYLWQMLKDTLAISCITIIANPKFKPVLRPVLAFSIIRSTWEIVACVFGQDVNSTPIVDYMFVILVVIVIWRYSLRWLEYRS